jgi:predicted DNA-binding protein
MGKHKYPPTTLVMPPELRETINLLAKQQGKTFSEMVCILAQTALDYHY